MKVFISTILLMLLVACGGTPTKTNYYLLRSDIDQQGARAMEDSKIGLEMVDVATYLEQKGLAISVDDVQINSASYHVWAEPLRHSLKKFMATEISQFVGKDINADRRARDAETRIKITVDQLHGTLDGEAILVAYWVITADKKDVSYQFSQSLALVGNGYAALVETEKQLLRDLARQIAKSLE